MQPHPVLLDVAFFTSEMSGCNASPPKLGSSAEQAWGRALQRLGQRTVKHGAWPCAVCDTLGMCPGSAKAGAGLRAGRREEVSKNPGLTEGLDPAWKVFFQAAALKPTQSSAGACCTLIFCCTNFADLYRKASDGNSNRGCKAQLAWSLVHIYMLYIIPYIHMVITDFST